MQPSRREMARASLAERPHHAHPHHGLVRGRHKRSNSHHGVFRHSRQQQEEELQEQYWEQELEQVGGRLVMMLLARVCCLPVYAGWSTEVLLMAQEPADVSAPSPVHTRSAWRRLYCVEPIRRVQEQEEDEMIDEAVDGDGQSAPAGPATLKVRPWCPDAVAR